MNKRNQRLFKGLVVILLLILAFWDKVKGYLGLECTCENPEGETAQDPHKEMGEIKQPETNEILVADSKDVTVKEPLIEVDQETFERTTDHAFSKLVKPELIKDVYSYGGQTTLMLKQNTYDQIRY